MKKYWIVTVLITLMAVLLGFIIATTYHLYEGPIYRGPIIDNHAHVFPAEAGDQQSYLEKLISAMDSAGVIKIVMGLNAKHVKHRIFGPTFDSIHDRWVMEAFEKYPERILPSLAGFDPQLENSVEYVEKQLKSGFWKEIGELDLRNRGKEVQIPADSPIMMRIYELAAEYHVPVSIHYNHNYGTDFHSGIQELERAVASNPDTIFITAHHANVELMKKYPNLWGEYEYHPWNPSLSELFRENKSLLNRIVIASDIQNPSMEHPALPWGMEGVTLKKENPLVRLPMISYEEKMELTRRELGKLPPEVAEKVAYKNLLEILNITK